MDPLSDYSSITSTYLDIPLSTDRIQQLLQSIGWTYYTIWEKESTPNPLSGHLLAWSKGGVNNAYESTSELFTCGNYADSAQITKAFKMGSSLQHFYKDCNFLPVGLGTISGVAMASKRYQFAFGKELLSQISLLSTYNQQSVPSELQEHFFQTVVWIPLPNGAGVLEMGTEKLVLEGDGVLSRFFYGLAAGTHTRQKKMIESSSGKSTEELPTILNRLFTSERILKRRQADYYTAFRNLVPKISIYQEHNVAALEQRIKHLQELKYQVSKLKDGISKLKQAKDVVMYMNSEVNKDAMRNSSQHASSQEIARGSPAGSLMQNIGGTSGFMQEVPNIPKDIELEDIFAPDFQRCYPDLMGECKVYVSLSPGESCDEFASFLTAELQKMHYNAIIISPGCLAEEKDQILCHRSLGLFVLSDSFFRNEGCLIDVLDFKNTQVPMLSLFYTLSMSEFRDEKGRELWRKEWKCWKKGNDNMANWEQAVEILGSCDHIELYNMKDSIMQYVQAVAEAVCHRVPLPVYWSKESSQVQGRIRMCEKVDALFQSKASLVTGGTQVLGMHGIWGAGKSTLGKVLCDFYSPEFGGRVCYVELGSTPLLDSSGVQVQQQKRILQQLFEASADFLEWRVRDSGQANAYMDYCLGEAFKKVFLVVDNIQNSLRSFEEARDLFMRKVPFPRGSKVLLLARSLHTLREFLQPLECLSDNVVQFPSNLLFEFSDQIFHQALVSGLSQSEVEILYKERDKDDIFRYFFPAFCRSRHPLTIKSLAAFSQAGGSVSGDLAYETELSDPHQKESREPPLITWEHNVRILRLIKEEGLLDNVFETLQKSYNLSLNSKEQQFFLDVALYMPSTNIHRLRRLYDDSDELFSTTSKCLRKLKDEALLTFKGREVQMPAVCRCFADQMVQRDLSAQMMYMARETVQWACVCDKVLRASNLDSLQRIAFESCHFVQGDDSYSCFTLDLSSCEHLRVLRLWGNKSEQTIKVQLGTANMLESLEILCNTSPITVTGYFPHVKCFKGDAGNHVIMDPPGLPKSLEVLEIFMPTHLCDLDQYLKQNCVNLDVLRLHSQVSYDIVTNGYNSRGNWIIRCGMIDLSYWINLRELVLEDVRNLRELRGLGMLRNLRVLHLAGLNKVNSLDEIKELGKLEEFHLLECSSLWILRLPCGNSLRHCCIYGCESLAIICVIKVEEEGEVEEEEEEEVNENRLWLQYDANWWRSLSTNGQLFNPDSHLCDGDQDQWRCFRFDSSTADSDLVPFNSGDHVNKFKVCKCPSLMYIDGLLELTAMQVFEFSQANSSKFFLYWHISDPLDIDITLSSDFPAAGWRGSEFVFERGVRGRAQLCSLEVVQEVGEGMVQELLEELQRRATALKKLAIRCGDSGKCGCEVHPPSFFLLPKSLKELKYDCPHVLDLSNMDKLGHQLTSLDLQGCKKVKMWPDFSHMSTLSALNLSNTSWSSEKKISKFCP